MANKSDIAVRRVLRKMFPSTELLRLARETGAVQRERKVKIVSLFWTLVLGFGVGRKRTISGLRRAYEKTTGQPIEESSFYNRFNRGLLKMMKECVVDALTKSIGVGRRLRGRMAAFRDVIMTDSTIVRLHELLADVYPANRTNHTKAALKTHVIVSVTGAGRQSVRITSERKHDGPVFRVGRWVAHKLLLFDLGYFNYHLFSCIDRNKGYFVSRLKANANPTIVAINRKYRGRAVDVVGHKLRDVLGRLKRAILDVEVEVRFRKRRYAGKRRYGTARLRLVAVRDERTGQYHTYVTNVSSDKLAAEDIQATYALRWQMELLFKELKTHYRLDDMPSRKRVVVEILLYAAIVTLLVSRRFLAVLRQRLAPDQAERLRHQRWASVFVSIAQDLLFVATAPYPLVRNLEGRLSRFIIHEAVDPNRSRLSLLQAAEHGRPAYRHRSS